MPQFFDRNRALLDGALQAMKTREVVIELLSQLGSSREAREYLRKAIQIDPAYADAWAALAWSYLANIMIVGQQARKILLEEGMKAAKEAVRLDGDSYASHYALGVAYIWHEDFNRGIAEAELALMQN